MVRSKIIERLIFSIEKNLKNLRNISYIGNRNTDIYSPNKRHIEKSEQITQKNTFLKLETKQAERPPTLKEEEGRPGTPDDDVTGMTI